MPPVMADYRVQARRRMKRGLHPDVVAAAGMQASTGEPRTNMTGNARQGQQYRDVEENGHHVHVYAGGERVGVADKINPLVRLPGERSGFAANSGQGLPSRRLADLTGQRAADQAQVSVGRPVKRGQGEIVQKNYDNEVAQLVALANAKRQRQQAPDAQFHQAALQKQLAAMLPQRKRRRGTGRITGGMLAS